MKDDKDTRRASLHEKFRKVAWEKHWPAKRPDGNFVSRLNSRVPMDPVELTILFAERGWVRWLPRVATNLLSAVNTTLDGVLVIHSDNQQFVKLGFLASAFVLEEEEKEVWMAEIKKQTTHDLVAALRLPRIETVGDVFALMCAVDILRKGPDGWQVNPEMPSVLDLPISDAVRQQEEAMGEHAKYDSLCARIVALFAESLNGKQVDGFQSVTGITTWTTSLNSVGLYLKVGGEDAREALRILTCDGFSCTPPLETLAIHETVLFVLEWRKFEKEKC